jgi:hypothetical protein
MVRVVKLEDFQRLPVVKVVKLDISIGRQWIKRHDYRILEGSRGKGQILRTLNGYHEHWRQFTAFGTVIRGIR